MPKPTKTKARRRARNVTRRTPAENPRTESTPRPEFTLEMMGPYAQYFQMLTSFPPGQIRRLKPQVIAAFSSDVFWDGLLAISEQNEQAKVSVNALINRIAQIMREVS